jgi:type III pantothenate kinase|tara:strand:- start:1133 stop:1879 length:747 start_codon:yes stop_codon:yes gene_type:complete
MKYIVGDIGNTSTKICILNNKFKIIKTFDFETSRVYNKNFLKTVLKNYLKKNLNQNLLFSSVVPSAFKKIKKEFKLTKYRLLEIKDFNLRKIIKINIKNKKQLGSDRIANAIGAKKFKNCLIIDFGTATTFDIIRNEVYEGGVIAPGVKLSIMNLSKSTALLPLINLKKNQKSFGKNTKEALNAGFVWGYEGLINNIINKIIYKDKTKYKIILTGGYANFFKKVIKRKIIIDQDVTIKGIANVYKEFI